MNNCSDVINSPKQNQVRKSVGFRFHLPARVLLPSFVITAENKQEGGVKEHGTTMVLSGSNNFKSNVLFL